mmetsp:Transcript_57000/g.180402  ORF Transcript_57000/g.180402 Transcript_57000/m.180402 type:complete len:228 (+) Transcript_57000:442-1125(+)
MGDDAGRGGRNGRGPNDLEERAAGPPARPPDGSRGQRVGAVRHQAPAVRRRLPTRGSHYRGLPHAPHRPQPAGGRAGGDGPPPQAADLARGEEGHSRARKQAHGTAEPHQRGGGLREGRCGVEHAAGPRQAPPPLVRPPGAVAGRGGRVGVVEDSGGGPQRGGRRRCLPPRGPGAGGAPLPGGRVEHLRAVRVGRGGGRVQTLPGQRPRLRDAPRPAGTEAGERGGR